MRRAVRWLALVWAMTLASGLAACGSSGDSGDVRQNIDQMRSFLGSANVPLPAVTVQLGKDGRVERLAGFQASAVDDVAEALTGQPLVGRIVVIEPKYLRWLDRADIQHITVASRPEGLFLLVNGRALPYLAWDEETAANLVDVLGKLVKEKGQGAYLLSEDAEGVVASVVPFLRALGARFDILLPDYPDQGPADRRPVPLPGPEAFTLALTDEEVDAKPLQSVDVEIDYQELADGRGWVPALFGLTTVQLDAVADPFSVDVPQLRMREDIRQRLQSEGIESVGIESRVDGLFVTVDGRLLPHLAWSEATLATVAQLLDQLYPPDTKLPSDAGWVPVVKSTAPMYNDYSIAVLVRFPTGEAGAARN
jgi:hypothetical protein